MYKQPSCQGKKSVDVSAKYRYVHSCMCHIASTSHVYGLTFMSGGGGIVVELQAARVASQ